MECERCNGTKCVSVLGGGGDYETWPCPKCCPDEYHTTIRLRELRWRRRMIFNQNEKEYTIEKEYGSTQTFIIGNETEFFDMIPANMLRKTK